MASLEKEEQYMQALPSSLRGDPNLNRDMAKRQAAQLHSSRPDLMPSRIWLNYQCLVPYSTGYICTP